jgi:hypothetical protein
MAILAGNMNDARRQVKRGQSKYLQQPLLVVSNFFDEE